MDYPNYKGEHNKNTDGYKVPGDGNEPNHMDVRPGNGSFGQNPNAMEHKNPDDIPGQEFNTGDKAFFDSSSADFVKTVSALHHADETDEDSDLRIDMQFKTPDGDR